MAAMLEFRTPGFNPYAVKYSPYYDNKVAVASAANFGIAGNGKLFVLNLTDQGVISLEKTFDTNDAQYDVAWSEINERQLIVACGDGSVKLFDSGLQEGFPVMSFQEHKRETFSVCWSPVTKDTFASSSWDGTVKIWSPTRNFSLKTLPIGSCTYSTSFCPSNPSIVSAVSSDSHLRIFDLRTPSSARYHLTTIIPVHTPPTSGPGYSTTSPSPPTGPAEVLTHDWNKYNNSLVATGGVDKLLRIFDIRNPAGGPLSVMAGHGYAVRRLAWSPHEENVLISASYDMTVRVWADGLQRKFPHPVSSEAPPQGGGAARQLGLMNRHTEFATGVDWCLFGEGWVASAGWDERVLLWDAKPFLLNSR